MHKIGNGKTIWLPLKHGFLHHQRSFCVETDNFIDLEIGMVPLKREKKNHKEYMEIQEEDIILFSLHQHRARM